MDMGMVSCHQLNNVELSYWLPKKVCLWLSMGCPQSMVGCHQLDNGELELLAAKDGVAQHGLPPKTWEAMQSARSKASSSCVVSLRL